jgi:hypothetical protein
VALFCRAAARPLGIRRKLCERLAVKVPAQSDGVYTRKIKIWVKWK